MSGENASGLHRFAVLTACAVLLLIGAGGLVTSHGAGLAVPDWPNTYGYNLFFFPISGWMGGIFYEHTHRLLGALVGLLTLTLTVWVHGAPARPWLRRGGGALIVLAVLLLAAQPGRWQDAVVLGLTGLVAWVAGRFWPRCEPQSVRVRRLSGVALGLVILQGVLGGLRVVKLQDELGIVHATLAQLFFVLMGLLALATSPAWRRFESHAGPEELRPLRFWYTFAAVLILGQLILGASMRHQHAGLAIPDFPLAYGRLWPPTDPDSLARYNLQRVEPRPYNDITAAHIYLHMAHRVLAVGILAAVAVAWQRTRTLLARGHRARKAANLWLGLVCFQFLLGAWTVWSNKAADVATLHVVTGAVTFMVGSLLALAAFQPRLQGQPSPRPTLLAPVPNAT